MNSLEQYKKLRNKDKQFDKKFPYEAEFECNHLEDDDALMKWLVENVKPNDYKILYKKYSYTTILFSNEDDINLLKLMVPKRVLYVIFDFKNREIYRKK